jgi:hypothetical protein
MLCAKKQERPAEQLTAIQLVPESPGYKTPKARHSLFVNWLLDPILGQFSPIYITQPGRAVWMLSTYSPLGFPTGHSQCGCSNKMLYTFLVSTMRYRLDLITQTILVVKLTGAPFRKPPILLLLRLSLTPNILFGIFLPNILSL